MRTPFNGNYKITQKFGNNPSYYKQFGFAGHEGVDWGTPNGTPILSSAKGVVVRRNDVKSGAYGVYLVVWHKELSLATWYCHLQENKVSIGDNVTEGQVIALSNNTGNTSGPHLHFNLCRTNSNGTRINQDNGYKGFIDPLPFLKEGENNMDPEIIKRADAFVAVCSALGKPVDKDIVIADIKRLLTLEDKLRERDADLDKKRAELEALSLKLEGIEKDKEALIKENVVLDNQVFQQQRRLSELTADLVQTKKEVDELKEHVPAEMSASELLFKFLKKLIGRR